MGVKLFMMVVRVKSRESSGCGGLRKAANGVPAYSNAWNWKVFVSLARRYQSGPERSSCRSQGGIRVGHSVPALSMQSPM